MSSGLAITNGHESLRKHRQSDESYAAHVSACHLVVSAHDQRLLCSIDVVPVVTLTLQAVALQALLVEY
jgi:uncharacterized protein YqfB (UPF0267 family)